jgi:opacity protein-like surface antigen
MGIALVVFATNPGTANAFITAGAEAFWVASGTLDTAREHTPDDGLAADISQDDTSGFGVTVYGMIGALPLVDAGLAIHYLPTLEVSDNDKTTHKIGSETDLDLRLGVSLPVPDILVAVHGEGGLTLYSPDGEMKDMADRYDTDETSPVGYNAGVGVKVGYSIMPMVSLTLGAEYQYYSFELFSGSKSSAGIGTETETLSASGTRLKINFGVNFDL